jgi:hypothetical protein
MTKIPTISDAQMLLENLEKYSIFPLWKSRVSHSNKDFSIMLIHLRLVMAEFPQFPSSPANQMIYFLLFLSLFSFITARTPRFNEFPKKSCSSSIEKPKSELNLPISHLKRGPTSDNFPSKASHSLKFKFISLKNTKDFPDGFRTFEWGQ